MQYDAERNGHTIQSPLQDVLSRDSAPTDFIVLVAVIEQRTSNGSPTKPIIFFATWFIRRATVEAMPLLRPCRIVRSSSDHGLAQIALGCDVEAVVELIMMVADPGVDLIPIQSHVSPNSAGTNCPYV